MSTHHSGQVIETGLRNSQDTVRAAGPRTGSIFIDATATDWVPAVEAVTLTRLGVGQYVKRRAAAGAARTDQLWFTINNHTTGVISNAADPIQLEEARGIRLLSVDLIYRPGVVGLTSLTPTLQSVTFTDGSALPAGTDSPLTPTLAAAGDITFHATNLQRARFTVTTPIVITAAMQMTVDITVVLAITGTLDWHGAVVNYDFLI